MADSIDDLAWAIQPEYLEDEAESSTTPLTGHPVTSQNDPEQYYDGRSRSAPTDHQPASTDQGKYKSFLMLIVTTDWLISDVASGLPSVDNNL